MVPFERGRIGSGGVAIPMIREEKEAVAGRHRIGTSSIVALVALWALTACGQRRTPPPMAPIPAGVPDLELARALPVEGVEGIEPSGLTIVDGELYTVHDKHDGVIYRLRLEEDRAMAVPHLRFTAPGAEDEGRLDFEGITHDAGGFYLVSETTARVLRVDHDGRAEWVTPSLEEVARSLGLLSNSAAGFEGIVRVGGDTFALVAEREPRALVEVVAGSSSAFSAFRLEGSRFTFPPARSPDLTGLFREDGDLWVLQRGVHAVCRVVRRGDRREEGECWSYARVENDPRYRYETMKFGRGEGVALDDRYVYVVLDNNRDRRVVGPDDRRPLLFVLRRPDLDRPGSRGDEPLGRQDSNLQPPR